MSQGQHRTRSRLGTRILIGLLSLATCAGLTFGLSPGAFAVSTTQLQWDLAGMAYLSFSGIDGVAGPTTIAAFQSDACLAPLWIARYSSSPGTCRPVGARRPPDGTPMQACCLAIRTSSTATRAPWWH